MNDLLAFVEIERLGGPEDRADARAIMLANAFTDTVQQALGGQAQGVVQSFVDRFHGDGTADDDGMDPERLAMMFRAKYPQAV